MENINEKVSVKRNALLNVIYTLVNIIFPVITFPYVSRVLSVEKMGAVSFYSSISNYAIIFGSLGVSVYGIRACAKVRDNKKILSQTVAELEVITLFATSIVIIVLIVASNFINRLNSEPLLLAINLVLIFSSAFSFDWLYSGVEQYDYITKRTIAIKLISLMLVYIFVKDREDYYKDPSEQTENSGLTEIIIAKHRNGALADIRLVFLKQFSKFANPARADQQINPLEGVKDLRT